MAFEPEGFPKVLTLYLELSQYPILASRIRTRMREEIFKRGIITREAFEEEVRKKAIQSQFREGLNDPFAQEAETIWVERLAIVRENLTDFYFAYNLPHDLFEDLIRQTLGERGHGKDIVLSIHPELAPWDMLFAQGEAYEALPPEERKRIIHHLTEIKVVLIKSMLSDHLEYVGIAKDWLDIPDLQRVREHRFGRGRIGGKAAGYVLAHTILKKVAPPEVRDRIRMPRSWFLGADVFYHFMELNNFTDQFNMKYKDEDEIRSEHPLIQERFHNAVLPEEISEGLRVIVEKTMGSPLIVRSSSLLEDSFGTSFAGKYESLFCPNQKSIDENLRNLEAAIRRVYSSVYNPESLLYRQRKGLTDYDERMAILVQEVQGRKRNGYFHPDAAGVAFSQNQFRWSPDIKRDAGFMRLVWGLGTRAVDQVGGDYPRLVALSHPHLWPESDPDYVHRYSQHFIDLIDLETSSFRSVPVSDTIKRETPYLTSLAQSYDQGQIKDFLSIPLGLDPRKIVLTFDGLLRRTSLPDMMREILNALEKAYNRPVDIEFTLDLGEARRGQPDVNISLVQCRPQSHLLTTRIHIPDDIPPKHCIFTTHRMVPDGQVENVRYLIFIPPSTYRQLTSMERMKNLAQVVGRLNKHLEEESFILIGPGRWGSNNPELGVPVTYSDIYNARALIEVADGHSAPEPSYGTHFFQDLVESNIYPLAVALDDPEVAFNRDFLMKAPNMLSTLLPEDKGWEEFIHVVDVPAATHGMHVTLSMDGNGPTAMAYLTD